MRGRFITFEGPEGSGKSTQAAKLTDRLRGLGIEVVDVREPGGTAMGEVLRGVLQGDNVQEPICPEAELLLFAASRAQLVRCVILPALESGVWVVCDRFADSTTAYQGYGRGFSTDVVMGLNDFAIGPAVPDLTVLLDVDLSEGFRRIRVRNDARNQLDDRFEREEMSFHDRVKSGYRDMATRWPERIRLVDGGLDEGVVFDGIWKLVSKLLPESE